MSRVIHFEIHAENPERALAFCRGLFGWDFKKYPGPMDYWLITTGPDGQPGINGGLIRRQGAGPLPGQAVNAFVCTVDTDNLDAHVAKALATGGIIALPKMPIPGVGWLAYVIDPEGNILGMMQADKEAK